ncbi:FAD-dependent oxidoreductase [Streptomyces sp. NPDC001680]
MRRGDGEGLGHAVVIGAGISGLLTARVLSDHFSQVTLIERDSMDSLRAWRSGVPQARHPHLLLARSQQIVEELFPGIWDDFKELDVPVFDFGSRTKMLFPTGFSPSIDSGVLCRSVSRPRYEAALRERVLALPPVAYQDGSQVVGLDLYGPTRSVAAVLVAGPGQGQGSGGVRRVAADMVVDASGRNSHLPRWLSASGLSRPRVSQVNPRLGYATRLYEIPDGVDLDWDILVEFTRLPSASRGCVGLRIENNQLLFTLQGNGGDYPPQDEEGFIAFARSLRLDVTDILARLKARSPIYCYRNTVNRWYAYHRMPRWPQNLIAVGDAHCVFNPIYGQGITVASQQALLLRSMLEQSKDAPIARTLRAYRARQTRQLRWPWLLSTSVDRGWQEAPMSLRSRFMSEVADAWMCSIGGDPEMFSRFITVTHMLSGPRVLLAPHTLARIGRAYLHNRRASGAPTERRPGEARS